ncbi:hypothetical protein Tco_1404861 [Tanacetum coccineum]
MRNKSVNDVVFNKEAHHLSFFDIKMSVRPKDVESASSVVEGRVPSRTGTAQMQSPEVDSETQLDEYGSSEGNVFSDPKTCLVSAPYLGETLSLKWMLFPVVVSLLRLKYTLEIVYSDISYLRIFRVETLFSILLENLMIPWLFRVCVLLLLWDDAYGSVSKTIFVPAVSPSKMMVLRLDHSCQYRKYLLKYCAAIVKIGTKRAEV